MAKRVFWKKGMRLTDEVLRMSDSYHAELVNQAFLLGAAGRFGLIPSRRPFRISLDFSKNIIEVTELDCLALTRGGQLIDASYDSRYTQAGETRVMIPPQSEDRAFLLLATDAGEWVDAHDGTCKPAYQFSLVPDNSPVPEDAFPVARIVHDTEWQLDQDVFVPPCLFLSSHPRYMRLCEDFMTLLERLDLLVPGKLITDSGDARRVFWPAVRSLKIRVDKEKETMTPMDLLARVQECVSAFYCACTLDECLSLSEGNKFQEFVQHPYHFRDCVQRIQEGLLLTADICRKIEDFEVDVPQAPEPASVPELFIPASGQHVFATSNNVSIEVGGLEPGATGFFSVDGSDPSKPLQNGRFVQVNPGFNKTRSREDDRSYIVKLKAVADGHSSRVTAFEVLVTKDVNVWKGFEI